MKKLFTLLALVFMAATAANAATPILAKPVASTDRMYQYVKSKSPGWSFSYEIAQNFHDIGAKWGVRGDIALCQSCIETGWFRYTGGTAVTPDDHNYCGLGVTATGYKGCQFGSVFEGVTAQLQHLWSYATTADLPSGWTKVDPRFAHGRRGRAPNWENLGSGNWASAYGYGNSIISVYNEMMAFQMANPVLNASPTDLTFSVQQNATSPVKTVKVTGSNLGSAIQMVANSSIIKYNTAGWNEYSGGEINVSVDTSKAPGTYPGGYIRVYSGDTSVKINITVEILGPPTITVSPTSLSFTATQGEAAKTATISVKGSSLTQDMTFVSNASMFAVKAGSNWNARTGGDLIVTLDTSKNPGTYTGYVAVQTNSSLRKQVDITATIKAKENPQPSITANTSTVNLSAKKGDAAPTTSVTIKAANLTRDMSYNCSSSAFTITAMPNWNARTGGTLNVTLNTDKDAGTYTGILAIAADTRLEIALNGTLSDGGVVPVTPTLSVSTNSVNLSAQTGAANPTSSVNVSAANQSSDIQYSVSGDGFSVAAASGWNARNGGTLNISFDASKAAGTYNGTLTVKTASNSETVALKAVISAAPVTPPAGEIPALDFKEIWNDSQAAKGSFSKTYRNFDYADGKLYVASSSDKAIYVLDARTGSQLKTLNNGSIVAGGAVAISDVAVLDGKIYASNIANAGAELRVYVWDNDDAEAQLFFSQTVPSTVQRLGDCLSLSKNSDGSIWVSFLNDNTSAKSNNIVEYRIANGSVAETKTVAATKDGSTLGSNVSSRVRRIADGYEVDGKNILPSVLGWDGALKYSLGTESCAWGNDFATFTYDNTDYMLVATYLNQTSTTYAEGIMRLYNVSNGWANATAVSNGDYPSGGLGSTRNTATTGSLRVNKVSEGCVEAWILTTSQGIAYYRSGSLDWKPGTDPGTDPDPNPPTPSLSLPNQFANDWEYSTAKGNSSSFMLAPAGANTRNMTMKDNKLYVVQRSTSDCNIHIVNAETGAEIGKLSNSGVTSSNFMYSSVANMGGTIIACNMGYSAATVLRVYGWSSDTAEPSLILETSNHGGRTGDLICASGDINNGKIYLTTNSGFSGFEGNIFVYNVTNGKADAAPSSTIVLKKADGSAYDLGAKFAVIEVKVLSDGTFQCSGSGGATAWFKADGTFIKEIPAAAVNDNTLGSSASVFDFGDYKLAASITYKGNWTDGYVTLANVTDMANPAVLKNFDVLGSTKNGVIASTVLTKVDDNKIHIWALIPQQGIAKYTATATSGVEDIQAAPAEQVRISYNGNAISANGEVAAISVYNVSGNLVAQTAGAELATDALPRGIYIVAVRTADGAVSTAKVAIR